MVSLKARASQALQSEMASHPRLRRAAQIVLRTTRKATGANQRAERRAAGDGAPGLESYDEWRAQQPAYSASVEAHTAASFVVLVEYPQAPSGDVDAAVAATVRSIDQQVQVACRAIPVASGAKLDEVLAGVAEDFVLILKAGSLLVPTALDAIAKQHRVDPELKVIVFDSDTLSAAGTRCDPTFRGAWSPETMLGVNYIGRAFAASARVVQTASDVTVTDHGIWRMFLTAELNSRVVGNVSQVLLSTPLEPNVPATEADAVMVRDSLRARGESAETRVCDGMVRVQFVPEHWPSVSIVIPTRHSRTNLVRLLPGLRATDYPEFDVSIVDNGDKTEDNENWYSSQLDGSQFSVRWWDEQPFNYSRVNNETVRSTTGDIVVLLNDDTEIVDVRWLREMVGLLLREGVGTVGFQLRHGDGTIQHGGVTIGPGGFADNLFTGLPSGTSTLAGSTDWYRNALAITGACVAIRRADFEQAGGLDVGFELCGSDVELGLDQIIRGRRNVVIPFDAVRHYESVTRGKEVPRADFFASYWRYHSWLQNGDPYLSPNLCRLTTTPRFASVDDPSPIELTLAGLGRPYRSTAQKSTIAEDATALMPLATISSVELAAMAESHSRTIGRHPVTTVNWFLPEFDMPFFGGISTTLRMAAKLARDHDVANRFIVMGERNDEFFSSAIAAAFPELAGSEIVSYDGSDESISMLPNADVAIATFWLTAFHVAKAPYTARKFYLMQDFEPSFYPASTLFAMAEQTYKLGLYGICNTESMHRIYTDAYGGVATYFNPAVDRTIYSPAGRRAKDADEPVTIFAYARDHFRNCWELVYAALSEIKRRYGDGVRIVAAGASYLPRSADFIDLHLLDYRATGALYRETDIGVTMQISRHPSYLPLELMASEVAIVAPASDWFRWLFDNRQNSVLSMSTVDDLVEKIDSLVRDTALRQRIAKAGAETIDRSHSDWDDALNGIYDYLCDPENNQVVGQAQGRLAAP